MIEKSVKNDGKIAKSDGKILKNDEKIVKEKRWKISIEEPNLTQSKAKLKILNKEFKVIKESLDTYPNFS